MSTPVNQIPEESTDSAIARILGEGSSTDSAISAIISEEQKSEIGFREFLRENIPFGERLIPTTEKARVSREEFESRLNAPPSQTQLERLGVPENVRNIIEGIVNVGRFVGLDQPGAVLPIGPGAKAISGIARGGRKAILSRVSGEKALRILPKAATPVATQAGVSAFSRGKSVLGKNLEEAPIGNVKETIQDLRPEQLANYRQGLLEGLRNNVSGMRKLTKTAQDNLLSPNGRDVLKEALNGMPDKEFKKIINLIERGTWQEARDRVLVWGVLVPSVAGGIGAGIYKLIFPK